MIKLEPESYFAKGGQRACYEFSEDANLCVKVEFTDDGASRERVEEELAAHHRVLRRGCTSAAVSLFRGEVETNIGRGYLFDLVRNSDGSIAPTLRNCEKELGAALMTELVRGFYREILSQKLVVGDLHPKNLVVRDREELVLIDGLGAVNLPWLYYHIGLMRAFKLRRKIRRLCRLLKIPHEGVWSD